jgi:hypothetical protein
MNRPAWTPRWPARWKLPPAAAARVDRFYLWAGHYQLLALLAAIPLGIAGTATGNHYAALTDISDVVWISWAAAMTCDVTRHQRALCERCAADKVVLDPQGAVRKWKWALWWQHHPWLLLGPVLLLVVLSFGSGAVHGEPPWKQALAAAVVLMLAVILLVEMEHRRLCPWCPYCRWGGRGDPERSPVMPDSPVAAR